MEVKSFTGDIPRRLAWLTLNFLFFFASCQKCPQYQYLSYFCTFVASRYVKKLTDAGFGTIEIRARKPYRILDPKNYATDELIYIESIEIAAIKDPMPDDGPCVFTGKTAIYYGTESCFDDNKGHVMLKNQPLAVCDKTAKALADLGRDDIFISESTFHYGGGGCC